jgi:protein involved in polysaccharide export with SLBB domain
MNRKSLLAFLLIIFFPFAQPGFPQTKLRPQADTTEVSRPKAPWGTQYRLGKDAVDFDFNQSSATAAGEVASSAPLPLFGIDLFSKGAAVSGEPAEAFVLPPNYKLGPGDKIGIFLLGKTHETLEAIINVEGKVYVPPAGVFHVWGLTLDEFKDLLNKKLSPYYHNFTLELMLLQPKNVMVAVVGEVLQPGKYVLSALNTVLDAVILAGGPTANGSMRGIQLLRDQHQFASIDLYQFLMSGQNDRDVFLEVGDRIVVPLAQNKISIAGEIKRPYVFELKPDGSERLTDLIDLAGGFTDFAFLDKIELSRLDKQGHRKVVYLNYHEIIAGDSTQNLILQNEDRVRVYSKLEQIHTRQVAIFGEIKKPGAYELEDNMHLSDLILKAGNLTRKAYTLEAEVAKIDPGQPTRFLKVNLELLNRGANGNVDILLEEDDQVFIRQIPEWEVGLTVEVQGEVMFPGKYSIVKDSTYLSEILQKAGGFTHEAFLQEAVVIRPSTRLKFDKEFERLRELRREEMSDLEYQYFVMRQNTADVSHIVVDFEKLVYENDHNQDVILEDGDIIVVPKAPTVVTVSGRVANPGGVTYVPGADLKYYLAKAGGASWDASLGRAKVIKVTGEVLDDEDVKSFEPGDIIWVPRRSDKKFWPLFLQTVSVMAQLASIYLIIHTSITN